MIMPTKFIREDEALIGVCIKILKKLSSEKSLSTLWENSKCIPNIDTYERFILALDVLFILGLIKNKSLDGYKSIKSQTLFVPVINLF